LTESYFGKSAPALIGRLGQPSEVADLAAAMLANAPG
jgi:hypothetical protein